MWWGVLSLFKPLLCAEMHLGPDGTRLKQNAQAGWVVYGNMIEKKI